MHANEAKKGIEKLGNRALPALLAATLALTGSLTLTAPALADEGGEADPSTLEHLDALR